MGYGTTADAHHVTSGPEDGDGARRAMEIAITQAGISPREVRHLNAHATSTQVGDLGEIPAIRVSSAQPHLAVSATKSATGHLLGAAGGLGGIFAILALRDQVAPPTLNLSAPDPAGDGIDFVASQARPMAMDYAISNGFGFGGVDASALFRRWTDEQTRASAGALMIDALRSNLSCFSHQSNTKKEMISMNKTNPGVALVTGASTGIGHATAKALPNAGFRVFGTSRRAAAKRSDGVTMLTCDVTDDASVAKLVDDVLAKAGRIDLLVNNAGMGLLGGAEDPRWPRLSRCST